MNTKKLREAAEVLEKALMDAALLLAEASAEAPVKTKKRATAAPRGRKVTDDKRRGRMSPNRLLGKTDLTPATVAKLAAKGITKVGQARRVLAGQTAPGVTDTKLTPAQKRALKRVLD